MVDSRQRLKMCLIRKNKSEDFTTEKKNPLITTFEKHIIQKVITYYSRQCYQNVNERVLLVLYTRTE